MILFNGYGSPAPDPTQPAITCSKLTTETLEQGVKYVRDWCRSGVFTVNFEHISHFQCF